MFTVPELCEAELWQKFALRISCAGSVLKVQTIRFDFEGTVCSPFFQIKMVHSSLIYCFYIFEQSELLKDSQGFS